MPAAPAAAQRAKGPPAKAAAKAKPAAAPAKRARAKAAPEVGSEGDDAVRTVCRLPREHASSDCCCPVL